VKYIIYIFIFLPFALCAQKAGTRYTLNGTAVHNGTSQGYRLDVVDDGTGKIKGENISIVENGRRIVGEVIGSINYAKKKIYFRETRVTNLRAGETQSDYCFFEINANYYIKEGRTIISGKFVGHSPNGTVCGGGDIYLMGPKNVEAIHQEYVKKVEAIKKAKTEMVKKTEPKPKIIIKPKVIKDTIKKQDVVLVEKDTKPKEKNIFPSLDKGVSMYEYDNTNIKLCLSDYDKIDGDRVSVYLNSKLLWQNYTLTNDVDTISINMNEMGNKTSMDTLIVLAHNEGAYSPNSAKIVILDGDQQFTYYACNNFTEKKYLILKKRQ
jgi:hypothetical protein